MYKKLRRFKKKNNKKRNGIKIQNIAYVDSSIIKELIIRPIKGKFKEKKLNFIGHLFRKYNIKNIIITHKLFLEIIGGGQIRSDIVKKVDIAKKIDESKKIIKDKIKTGEAFSQEDVAQHQIILESIFNEEFKQAFPQVNLYNKTIKSLKNYRFHKRFHRFHSRVLEYARSISSNEQKYNHFIATLVDDSVIRYLLELVINVREFSPKYRDHLENAFTVVNNFILLKYVKRGLLHTNLIVLMSGRFSFVNAKLNPDEKNVKRLLYPKDDFADSEMQFVIIYGHFIKELRYRVIVFSAEPKESIEERIKYYNKGVETIINYNLAYKEALAVAPNDFLKGKSIVINFKELKYISAKITNINIDKNKIQSSSKNIGLLMRKKIWGADYH